MFLVVAALPLVRFPGVTRFCMFLSALVHFNDFVSVSVGEWFVTGSSVSGTEFSAARNLFCLLDHRTRLNPSFQDNHKVTRTPTTRITFSNSTVDPTCYSSSSTPHSHRIPRDRKSTRLNSSHV